MTIQNPPLHRVLLTSCCSLLVLVASSSPLGAEPTPAVDSDALLVEVSQARDAWQPVGADELVSVRLTAKQQLASFSAQLSSLRQRREKWKTYLLLDKLQEELSKPTPSPAYIREGRRRLIAGQPHLQSQSDPAKLSASFTALAELLCRQDSTKEQFEGQLNQLESAIRIMQYGVDDDVKAQAARTAAWLSERGLAPKLVNAIDERYRQPNVKVYASEKLLNAIVSTTSRERSPYREVLLGTVYRGTNTTDSHLSLSTEPAEGNIALTMHWDATVASRSHSSQRRVDVSSRSTTRISATKQLIRTPDSWSAEPAEATASTSSRITGINVRRLIGRRAARSQVYQQKNSVARAAARRAQSRTQREFDRHVAKMLDSMRYEFVREVRLPLVKRDQLPETVNQRSTSDSIELALLQANRRQLGAATAMPVWVTGQSSSDLSLTVHQSAWDNFSAGMFAGEQLREDQIAEQISRRLGWTPEGLAPEDADKMWSIHFHEENPVVVDFADGTVTVTIRAQGFTVGEKVIPSAQLQVTYNLNVVDSQLIGEREGRINIVPLQTEGQETQVGVRYQVFRTMLRRRFDRVFPEEFSWNELPLPESLAQRARLNFARCLLTDGWLQLDCQLPSEQPADKLASRAAPN